MKILFYGILVLQFGYLMSQGGMWQPQKLASNEKEMQAMGMKMSISDIYNEDKASIKDAIVHFNKGCTAEMISPQGLLLTNHHCGYAQIQAHSTLENDLLKNGFWATDTKSELPNKALTATFIVSITDVTNAILNSLMKKGEPSSKRQENIESIKNEIIKTIQKEDWQEVEIKSFYNDTEFYAFITETFKDVRLVGAPPSSIGKFGSDTDNWVWPRHTGDFSLFRIYADPNNHPADYAEENVPYQPKAYLPVSIKGIQEDDFTLVYGFPGQTDEYLTSYALAQTLEVLNPAKIAARELTLNILDKKMREDDATRIKYASKYAGIANYWKKMIGENQGLRTSHAIEKREHYQDDYKTLTNTKTLQRYYVLPKMKRLYEDLTPYALNEAYFEEIFYRNSETFNIALQCGNLLDAYKHDTPNEYLKVKDKIKARLTGKYKNYDADLDMIISDTLYELYMRQISESLAGNNLPKHFDQALYKSSIVPTQTLLSLLNESDDSQLMMTIQNDPLVSLVQEARKSYKENVWYRKSDIDRELNDLQRVYMEGQRKVFKDKSFFPDANSTLRVTYGKVKGYKPKDAVYYDYQTHLAGAIEKYKPNDYEFDIPEKLRQLYDTKDYGIYGQDNKMPLAFIATNHTTGGNSGSPVLDANGNLIGLNFDRVWEGTMSDLNYDAAICRNVMVDARYILFIIDQYAEADYLIDEMTVVK